MQNDLEIDVAGHGIATVSLNRPDAMNAVTDEMLETLAIEIPRLGRDRAVRALVLRSAGRGFCAGADVKRLKGSASPLTFEERVVALQRKHEIVIALHEMPKVTIARVQGVAAGAGLGLALACDFRFAGPNARFTTGFVKVGFSGDFGGTYFLSRIVGPDIAQQLYLTSETIGAEKAAALGIASRLVEDDDALDRAVAETARDFAAGPCLAHGYIKANFRDLAGSGLRAVLDVEAFRQIRLAQSEDHTEAITAFAEKRAPVFNGQ